MENNNYYIAINNIYFLCSGSEVVKNGDWILDLTTDLVLKINDLEGYLYDNRNGAKWVKIKASNHTDLNNDGVPCIGNDILETLNKILV